MARPRSISDVDALALARACIVEHGPGVSLAVLAKAVGLTPPALIRRFGSKERLLFRALLPSTPPRWRDTLLAPPGDEPVGVLTSVLVELCQDFQQVGPALAALRMSPVEVDHVFPPDQAGPAVLVRRAMARWLGEAGCGEPSEILADAVVGAAEARGYLAWIGPQMVDSRSDEDWAHRLATTVLGRAPR
jgi:AcrR family transcriptional regulator